MVYGAGKNGVIQIEGATLREGTRVRVEPIESVGPSKRGSAQVILERLRPWCGEPGELESLEKQIQLLRDQNIEHNHRDDL